MNYITWEIPFQGLWLLNVLVLAENPDADDDGSQNLQEHGAKKGAECSEAAGSKDPNVGRERCQVGPRREQ